jgi:hypothetical protein
MRIAAFTAARKATATFSLRDEASKNPSAAKRRTVQAVQYVQTVQVVESFEGSENGINPDVPCPGNRRRPRSRPGTIPHNRGHPSITGRTVAPDLPPLSAENHCDRECR